jgi:hypothetical protein
MSQSFGSNLKPVEIPHPDTGGNTSPTTTPTFSPANKPTPLVGSWADIGWEKAGEPNSATVNASVAANGDVNRQSTPLLPSKVSAFDERRGHGKEGTDEYLSNLLTETAKITDDGDDSDDGKPPKRASTPPPPSDPSSGGGSTYGRGGGASATADSHGGPGYATMPHPLHGSLPHPHHFHSHGHHHHSHSSYGGGSGYGNYSPHGPSGYYGSGYPSYQGNHAPYHQHHHQYHSGMGGPHGVYSPHHQHHQTPHHPPASGSPYGGQGHYGQDRHFGPGPNQHSGQPTSNFGAGQQSVSKFTPPPPPNVALANELAAPDSDTPANKVGDVLFTLGRRWVQKLEAWLAAHPKERPNAPCPAAEQYTTIETWLEKLNAWYEANFNGRKLSASHRGGRGTARGGRGGGRGQGGRGIGPGGPSLPVTDEQTWGTAW